MYCLDRFALESRILPQNFRNPQGIAPTLKVKRDFCVAETRQSFFYYCQTLEFCAQLKYFLHSCPSLSFCEFLLDFLLLFLICMIYLLHIEIYKLNFLEYYLLEFLVNGNCLVILWIWQINSLPWFFELFRASPIAVTGQGKLLNVEIFQTFAGNSSKGAKPIVVGLLANSGLDCLPMPVERSWIHPTLSQYPWLLLFTRELNP